MNTSSAPAPRTRRRHVLAGAAVAAATLGGVAAASRHGGGAGAPRSTAVLRSRGGVGRFGMTISNPVPEEMDAFIADLDRVRDMGLSAVRFGAQPDALVDDWGARDGRFTGEVVLSAEALRALADGMDEAEARGLRCCVMTIGVYPGDDVDQSVFGEIMADYWQRVAAHVAPRAPVWQVFNEPDGDHYRTYEPSHALENPAYVAELASMLDLARRSIHAGDPRARVTTNLGGYPVDGDLGARWRSLLDRIAASLDVITVDAYPDNDPSRVRLLTSLLDDLSEQYGKPVELGEIGMTTSPEGFSLQEQATAFQDYLDQLARTTVETVYFYALHDSDPTTWEGAFGVLEVDGSPKPAVEVIEKATHEER